MAEHTRADRSESPIRVVRGNPDETELAALITALATVPRPAPAPSEPAGLSAWGAYWYRFGRRPGPGVSGWRASTLPR